MLKRKGKDKSGPTKGPSRLRARARLEDVELMKLRQLDADLRASIASAKLAGFEMVDIRAKNDKALQEKDGERRKFLADAASLKVEYDCFTKALAKKYGVENPKAFVVDPTTGAIMKHQPERDPHGSS